MGVDGNAVRTVDLEPCRMAGPQSNPHGGNHSRQAQRMHLSLVLVPRLRSYGYSARARALGISIRKEAVWKLVRRQS